MLAAFTFGINHINSADFTGSLLSVRVLPFLIGALLLLITTFLIEKNAENPIIKLSYLRNRQILIVATIAIATGILQSSFVFIPNFAEGAFQIEASDASFMTVPLVLATAIGSPLFGRLIDNYGSKIIILIGLGLSVPSGSSLRYVMLKETSMVERAVTQGMLTIFISLGQLTGASLIGVVIAHKVGTEGYENVILYQSMLLVLIIVSAFLLKNRRSELKPV